MKLSSLATPLLGIPAGVLLGFLVPVTMRLEALMFLWVLGLALLMLAELFWIVGMLRKLRAELDGIHAEKGHDGNKRN